MSGEDKKPGVFSRLFGRGKPGPTTVAEAVRPDVPETDAIAPEIIAPEIIEPDVVEQDRIDEARPEVAAPHRASLQNLPAVGFSA